MALPLSSKLEWSAANPIWSAAINPVLANPMNNIQILSNIVLKAGVNVINTKLGRMMVGWQQIDIQGAASVYRSAPFNETTLTLTSTAPVIISLGVF